MKEAAGNLYKQATVFLCPTGDLWSLFSGWLVGCFLSCFPSPTSGLHLNPILISRATPLCTTVSFVESVSSRHPIKSNIATSTWSSGCINFAVAGAPLLQKRQCCDAKSHIDGICGKHCVYRHSLCGHKQMHL